MKKPRRLVEVEVLCTPELNVEILQDPITGIELKPEIIPGIKGTTFIPAVSSEGIISWTNDGDLPNPESVSIIGPQGERGEPGPVGEMGPVGPVGPVGP
jgi:hypothetical protein